MTVTPRANVLRVVHANQTACDLRVRPGQALADVRAMVPGLVTYDDDPDADRRELESLAVWANCLSPVVHIEGDDTLLVDVTGCQRLFHGEENLMRRAIEGFAHRGFTVRAAVADTPGAAWALAHAHPEGAVISVPGQLVADLAPLPVWSLRIEERVADSLASLGVQTVASLLHLPRSSLMSRFGEDLPERLDRVLGNLPEVLIPYRPHPVLTSRCHFGTATTRLDVLQEGLRRTLERFCRELAHRVAGVCQMFVTFHCPDVAAEQGTQDRSVTFPVRLSQPTRSVEHLYSLLVVLLDKLSLPAPADSLMLWAREIDRLDDWQDELFTTDANDARQLGDLVDRLAVRLGPQAVVRPELISDHEPERAFRYVSLVGSNGTSPTGAAGKLPSRRAGSPRGRSSAIEASVKPVTPRRLKPAAQVDWGTASVIGLRPLRLSPRPLEIAATSLVPEGPPIAFRLQGARHEIADSIGPERIETGWWRGPHVKRDYYRVTTRAGRRFWLFRERDTSRWFLHGWFD